MGLPTRFDFPPHYGVDGLRPYILTVKDENGDMVNLTGFIISIQLKTAEGNLAYAFSTTLTGEHKLTILADGTMQFPTIKKWVLPAGEYNYDCQVVEPSGFVTTYFYGIWVFKKGILLNKVY